jgi:hypothetical protein
MAATRAPTSDEAFAQAMAAFAHQTAEAMRLAGDTRQLLILAIERQGQTHPGEEPQTDDDTPS